MLDEISSFEQEIQSLLINGPRLFKKSTEFSRGKFLPVSIKLLLGEAEDLVIEFQQIGLEDGHLRSEGSEKTRFVVAAVLVDLECLGQIHWRQSLDFRAAEFLG